jgi:glycine hydroxymethyltransferase
MPLIADFMDRAVTAADDGDALAAIAGEVRELMAGYPMPGFVPAP